MEKNGSFVGKSFYVSGDELSCSECGRAMFPRTCFSQTLAGKLVANSEPLQSFLQPQGESDACLSIPRLHLEPFRRASAGADFISSAHAHAHHTDNRLTTACNTNTPIQSLSPSPSHHSCNYEDPGSHLSHLRRLQWTGTRDCSSPALPRRKRLHSRPQPTSARLVLIRHHRSRPDVIHIRRRFLHSFHKLCCLLHPDLDQVDLQTARRRHLLCRDRRSSPRPASSACFPQR